MVTECKDICREGLVLLLEKGISPGRWDKEVHEITYKIVSELIEYSPDIKVPRKIVLKEFYVLWMIGYC